MTLSSRRVTIHTDGGARGNPGPAAAAFVIRDAADGKTLLEGGVFLGEATNNVAEYRGLIAGLQAAQKIGATSVEVISDSELLVQQMTGAYRVKNAGLRPLYETAVQLRETFKRFSIRHVRREQNKDADRLVNEAIDRRQNVEDVADV